MFKRKEIEIEKEREREREKMNKMNGESMNKRFPKKIILFQNGFF